jgi:hypothetical protein
MTVHRQQTRHQDLTILRANEHFHDCSGGHFKIFPLYEVNTEGDFIRRRKITGHISHLLQYTLSWTPCIFFKLNTKAIHLLIRVT